MPGEAGVPEGSVDLALMSAGRVKTGALLDAAAAVICSMAGPPLYISETTAGREGSKLQRGQGCPARWNWDAARGESLGGRVSTGLPRRYSGRSGLSTNEGRQASRCLDRQKAQSATTGPRTKKRDTIEEDKEGEDDGE